MASMLYEHAHLPPSNLYKNTHVHGHCISKDTLCTNKNQDVDNDNQTNELDDVVGVRVRTHS